MRNKFEALTAFQSWPEDWQRLCAEYWTENDKPNHSHRAEHFDPDAVAKIAASMGESGRIVRKRKKNFKPKFWTAIELEYLHKCHQTHARGVDAAKMFLEKYPGRSEDAIEIQIRKQIDLGWKINY